jgi:hypothetical protein
MSGTAERVDALRLSLALRVLGGDFGAAQMCFDQGVLDRYRAQSGWRVMRTDTVGRVKSPAGWSLDFGIAEGDALVNASLADLSQRLPADERQHWAQHMVAPAVSRAFVSMRLAPGSCFDDGELRDWTPETGTQG